MSDLSSLFQPGIASTLRQYAEADSVSAALDTIVQYLALAANGDITVTATVAWALSEKISRASMAIRKMERTLDDVTHQAWADERAQADLPPEVVRLADIRAQRVRRIPIAQGPVGA